MTNGNVYVLKSNNSKTCYIGSCKGYISTRLAQHHYYYKKWLEGTHNTHRYSSFLVYVDDPQPETECLEKVTGTKEEVRARETYWVNEYRKNGWDVVNVNSPTYDVEKRRATSRLYYKTHIAEKRAYYQKNRDKIIARANAHYVHKKQKKTLDKDIVKEI